MNIIGGATFVPRHASCSYGVAKKKMPRHPAKPNMFEMYCAKLNKKHGQWKKRKCMNNIEIAKKTKKF